jgi:hypothetical protein
MRGELTAGGNGETLAARHHIKTNDLEEDIMGMRTCWAVACASVVMVASMNARAADPAPGGSAPGAETPPATATTNAPEAAPAESKMRIALNVVPMPFLGKL